MVIEHQVFSQDSFRKIRHTPTMLLKADNYEKFDLKFLTQVNLGKNIKKYSNVNLPFFPY